MKNINFRSMIVMGLLALGAARLDADPYASMRYKDAFDQTKMYEKYRSLMEKLGCAQNVFQSDADADSITRQAAIVEDQGAMTGDEQEGLQSSQDNYVDPKELEAFQQECLSLLNSARRYSLSSPLFKVANDLAFSGLAAAIAMNLMKDSVAGGFSGLDLIYKSVYGLKDSTEGGYNLIYPPNNSLEGLENHFAKNKCFIPRALWPKIMKSFAAARENELTRELHTHFIDFALGFTVFKPKPIIAVKSEMSLEDIKKELNKRIDEFFGDYKTHDDIAYIKINVAKFVNTLLTDQASKAVTQAPRYIYLYGSGGIGKTHFVQTLAEWIDELIPNSVKFEDLVINTYDDLEGSAQYPGAFLKVLRNQLVQNKRGSVVIVDEATWLNSPGMISPAKRIFNGDRSKLTTAYFGSNMDGSGVSLEIPPMLIFVAANEEIMDPALKSRFDTVYYPSPSLHALEKHAYKVAEKSKVLHEAHCPIDKDLITKWVETLDEKDRNFRFVAGNIEPLLLAAQEMLQSQELSKSDLQATSAV